MDALIGLSGVVLGWLLGFATDYIHQRVQAQRAAALVLAELGTNMGTLVEVKSGDSLGKMEPLGRDAWDDHSLVLQRILKETR